ncbi:Uncharacterised protein [Chlamydia trachomatis]|nr:Uncharacterised protein [Chlamydia trachomatis]
MGFIIEPGSNTSLTALTFVSSMRSLQLKYSLYSLGLKKGYCAKAKISPVCEFSTIARPLRALASNTPRAISCSAIVCTLASIVR